ncbi:hypothetical protein M413DRAFT_140285 [Hebeloma cylindrosporum]|uniref:Major facilitator superfamily (MFS) profile domain-containing protein n=1 Tax=Hebeloma cylindrosporum TaxID=76867 RepID=A0A0C3CE45_HEBCY|nr:hypothetical protein M413DRAFT_140285 [Hebeloma cylindrosporum h7]
MSLVEKPPAQSGDTADEQQTSSPKSDPKIMEEAEKPSVQRHNFPDGGGDAWTVSRCRCLAGHLHLVRIPQCIWSFQAYYKSHQLAHKSESEIAWIGSFQTFCMFFMGSVFGSIFDRFGARSLVILGGVGFSFACMMQSIWFVSFEAVRLESLRIIIDSTEYWQFFLAQALLQGICLSALFSPTFPCINHWFFKRRGLALGIATSGSSVGGVVWPIMINNLIIKVGFGWALRICGFFALVMTAGAATMVKGRLPPRTDPEFFAFPLFRQPAYTFFCFGMLFIIFGIFFLIFYIPSYGAIHGFSPNMIFYSVSILNAASFFGRIFPGMAADTRGRYNIMIIASISSAVLTIASIAATDTSSILVIGAMYGFTSGSIISIQAACIPPLLDDPRKTGVAIGQMLSIGGFGALLGPPICGWLITSHGCKGAQIFSGVMLAIGTVLLVSNVSYCALADLFIITWSLDIDHRLSPEATSQNPPESSSFERRCCCE